MVMRPSDVAHDALEPTKLGHGDAVLGESARFVQSTRAKRFELGTMRLRCSRFLITTRSSKNRKKS